MTMTKTAVSGAELKVRLTALGLPPSWFADRMNCTMRTVVRWFDADAVSPAVADELELLCDRTDAAMRQILDSVDAAADDVVLKTYRTDEEFVNLLDYPASWHRMVVFRVMEQLQADGKNVTVEYH